MIHAALLILLIMGLSLIGTVWLYVVVRMLMAVFLDAASTDVTLARLGLRFLSKNRVLFPGLFPVSTKVVDADSSVNSELSTHTAEELDLDTKNHFEVGGIVEKAEDK